VPLYDPSALGQIRCGVAEKRTDIRVLRELLERT
jgi:hypothetical protein